MRFVVALGQALLRSGRVPGLHFFTLNLEHAVTTIVHKLGLARSAVLQRRLPWRASGSSKRGGEDVRPIFWANRPSSYLKRTEEWASFPRRRWGDSKIAAMSTIAAPASAGDLTDVEVSVMLFTVTFYANHAHNLTRSP